MGVALGNRDSISGCGLLLVGHGTRDERGLAEFHDLARQVTAQASGLHVEPCFLELAQPDIPTAVGRLIDRGVRQLTIAPLMLFAAGHAKRDIPQAVEEALKVQGSRFRVQPAAPPGGSLLLACSPAHSVDEISITYLPALECDLRILDLSRQRFDEALAGQPPVDPLDTLLLLVARGSSSPEATAMMHEFAELRSKSTPVARVGVCFVAKAQPSLEAALASAAQSHFRRIVVQPHLLFNGQVLDEVRQAVSTAASSSNSAREYEWIVTQHLGPSPLVAKAIADAASISRTFRTTVAQCRTA